MSQPSAEQLTATLQDALNRAYMAMTPDEWNAMSVSRDRMGDQAYSQAGAILDRALRDAVKSLGLRFEGRFPPPFAATHETPGPDGSRVRWYEGILVDASGQRVARLRLGYYHYHDHFEVPRPPEVIVERLGTTG